MAKAVKVKVKLESTAGTGTFYLAEKNPRTHPEKLSLKKYDKKSKKHEELSTEQEFGTFFVVIISISGKEVMFSVSS